MIRASVAAPTSGAHSGNGIHAAGEQPAASSAPGRITLRPRHGWQPIDLRELWHYRELLWILALRDIKVRYKQTVLGAAWAIIQPLFTMVVFTIISNLGNLSTDDTAKPLFYFCGLLPWQLFAGSLIGAGNSLVGNQHLITKVYFPRLVIPIASVLTGLIDFAIAQGVLLVMMAWYHQRIGPQVLLMPTFIALAFMASLGVGLWLSALNVEFRDVRYAIPFMTQLWMFCTPILYSSTAVTTPWKRLLLGLNPMSGVVEGFRWTMLGKPVPDLMFVVSVATILTMLVGGVFYFRRMERTFADRV
jgi:lipopolysaccharide transport system permease protein